MTSSTRATSIPGDRTPTPPPSTVPHTTGSTPLTPRSLTTEEFHTSILTPFQVGQLYEDAMRKMCRGSLLF